MSTTVTTCWWWWFNPCSRCAHCHTRLSDAHCMLLCSTGTYADSLRDAGSSSTVACTECPAGTTTLADNCDSINDCAVCKAGFGGEGCATPCGGVGAAASYGPVGRPIGSQCTPCAAAVTGYSFILDANTNDVFAPRPVAPIGAKASMECLAEYVQVRSVSGVCKKCDTTEVLSHYCCFCVMVWIGWSRRAQCMCAGAKSTPLTLPCTTHVLMMCACWCYCHFACATLHRVSITRGSCLTAAAPAWSPHRALPSLLTVQPCASRTACSSPTTTSARHAASKRTRLQSWKEPPSLLSRQRCRETSVHPLFSAPHGASRELSLAPTAQRKPRPCPQDSTFSIRTQQRHQSGSRPLLPVPQRSQPYPIAWRRATTTTRVLHGWLI